MKFWLLLMVILVGCGREITPPIKENYPGKWPAMNVGAEAMTPEDVSLLNQTGITHIRVPLWWAWWYGEQEIRWDNFVKLADSTNIEILAAINAPPGQYKLGEGVREFTDFVSYVMDRYPSITTWQIMNEFGNHSPMFWGDSLTSETDRANAYKNLLCASYHVIKDKNPDAVVVSIAMTPNREFLSEFTKLGGWECVDRVAVHNYEYNLLEGTRFWVAVVREYTNKPIWVTEIGRLTDDDQYHLNEWKTAAKSSTYGVERWYGFTWKAEDPWGVLRLNGKKRPTYYWLMDWNNYRK